MVEFSIHMCPKRIGEGFVRFVSSKDARNAIEKNNGLLIRGRRIIVTESKHKRTHKMNSSKDTSMDYSKQEPKGQTRVQKAAPRDHRSYRDVVQHYNTITSHTTKPLQDQLKVAYICGQNEELSLQEASEKVMAKGLNELIVSKLDDLSVIVSKKKDKINYPMSKEEQTRLKTYFKYVVLWFKEYRHKDIRRC